MANRTWADHPDVEVVEGDLAEPESLDRALEGCTAAYYLVHSMLAAGDDYADQDRRLAGNSAGTASGTPTLERIVYLGGLGETGENLRAPLLSSPCSRASGAPPRRIRRRIPTLARSSNRPSRSRAGPLEGAI